MVNKTVKGAPFDANGVATLKLKHGDVQTLELLANLTYAVSEAPVAGYSVFYQINGGAEQSTALVPLKTVTVLNRKDEAPITALDTSHPLLFSGMVAGRSARRTISHRRGKLDSFPFCEHIT
ncbi:MAG: hypothetical protein SPI19_00550 [Peptoniphilaceae bacterium]|nr:hypothetical protein [Peptoniphilaceae bacterium]